MTGGGTGRWWRVEGTGVGGRCWDCGVRLKGGEGQPPLVLYLSEPPRSAAEWAWRCPPAVLQSGAAAVWRCCRAAAARTVPAATAVTVAALQGRSWSRVARPFGGAQLTADVWGTVATDVCDHPAGAGRRRVPTAMAAPWPVRARGRWFCALGGSARSALTRRAGRGRGRAPEPQCRC